MHRAPLRLQLPPLVLNAPDRSRAEDQVRALAAIFGDARAMATLSPDGLPLTPAAIEARLERFCQHWDEHGFGVWLAHDDTGFVGYAGIHHTIIEGEPGIEVLYAIAPEYWRRGHASRMARAMVEVGFTTLGLAELWCFTLTTNVASQRVMERAGFVYERPVLHAGLPHVFYRQAAEDHADAQDDEPPAR